MLLEIATFVSLFRNDRIFFARSPDLQARGKIVLIPGGIVRDDTQVCPRRDISIDGVYAEYCREQYQSRANRPRYKCYFDD